MSTIKSKLKTKFWRTDWFVGLCVVLAVLLVNRNFALFDILESRYYDFGLTSTSKKPSDQIAVIAIDDQSIANIGRWPWPREVQAKLIGQIASGKPKVIANTIFYSEPQVDRGLEYVKKMKDALAGDPSLAGTAIESANKIAQEAETVLNGDGQMVSALGAAGNVALAANILPGEPLGRPDKPLTPAFAKSAFKVPDGFGVPASALNEPLESYAAKALAIGHVNQQTDDDGRVRRELLVVDYYGQGVASLALISAAKYLNLNASDIKVDAGLGKLTLGKLQIDVDDNGSMRPLYYPDRDAKKPFAADSAFDVISGKVPATKFAGKLVILGTNAGGLGVEFATPLGRGMAPVDILAHTTSSILSEHFVTRPVWAQVAVPLVYLLIGAFLFVLLPRLSAAVGAAITVGMTATLLVTEYAFLSGSGKWVPFVFASSILVIGYVVLSTKRYFFTEQGKAISDEKSAETSRMMGLAEQGGGRPDLAFDWFRKVPLNDTHGPAVMDNLYNLALDFERKRQFNKAQAVYEYMSAYDKNYKDLGAKLNRAKNLSETVILGGGGSHPGGTLILDNGAVEKPMLGRYQVEKELGKGAMGVVYLGKDPKIGRVVAIKTMALSNEFEGEELVDARERFFREAETAGRLQHQNIVTIFDAGEEHDLAYIAMEFLKGKDLVDFTKQGALLPMATVVSICARVAEALSYAHTQNVVHRDIKPANIMYELSSDTCKVTDFGIARITDSSKTKTGLVLGTPSFMSPEQLAGKKVDGRSDLYSLGVMLFQMLAGVLPFRGDSMAELMYKIANEEAPDIRIIREEIPVSLANVVAVALSKRSETRYQTGDQFAADLRAALAAPLSPVSASKSARVESPFENVKTDFRAGPAPVDNHAMDKTAVMSVQQPTETSQATQAFVRTDALEQAPVFDKTDILPRTEPGVGRTPVPDPFEKTIISAPRKPADGGQ